MSQEVTCLSQTVSDRVQSYVGRLAKDTHNCRYFSVNSLRPNDAYMRQQTSHHWFRLCRVAWSAPSHYLNQWWFTIIWIPGTNFSEILIESHAFSLKKMDLKMSFATTTEFLSLCSQVIVVLYSKFQKDSSAVFGVKYKHVFSAFSFILIPVRLSVLSRPLV